RGPASRRARPPPASAPPASPPAATWNTSRTAAASTASPATASPAAPRSNTAGPPLPHLSRACRQGRSAERHAEDPAGEVRGVGDGAHPQEFLVELAALHRGVLFALEVREDAADGRGGESPGRDEHSALHHQMGHPEAAQEGRLATPVRAGDHDEVDAVGGDV